MCLVITPLFKAQIGERCCISEFAKKMANCDQEQENLKEVRKKKMVDEAANATIRGFQNYVL